MPSTFDSRPVSRAASLLTLLALLARCTFADGASMNAMTYIGCFSSSQPLTDQGSYTYQTSGYCQPLCVDNNAAVLGLSGGSDCWCGDQLPSADSKVGDDKCDSPCDGYDKENCGGDGFYSVYLSGTKDKSDVSNYGGGDPGPSSKSGDSSPTDSSPTTQAPSPTNTEPTVVTSVAPGTTVVVTMPAAQQTVPPTTQPSSESDSDSKDSGPNVAGIAAGVVVGVVAAIAIAAGLFFWLRHRRRQAADEEYKRTQVSDFMRGSGSEGKPPNTGYSHMSDTRLDPEAGRRNSAGSIADDQDYSRRILRVANPDSS